MLAFHFRAIPSLVVHKIAFYPALSLKKIDQFVDLPTILPVPTHRRWENRCKRAMSMSIRSGHVNKEFSVGDTKAPKHQSLGRCLALAALSDEELLSKCVGLTQIPSGEMQEEGYDQNS